jgi:hypothetical protein
MKRIVPLFVLAVFVITVLLVGLPASSAHAFDPPWPAGIPWPTTVPWPTANPLKLGVPWSPSYQSYPVYVATPVPLPAAPVAAALSPLPSVVVSSGVPASSPLPPVVVSSGFPAPLPPVIPSSNNFVPANVATSDTNSDGGSTRYSALIPGDTWRALSAGASVWYRIGASGEHMDVRLNASPLSGVSMVIYAPNGSDQPIGRGTLDNADSSRLIWSGGHWNGDGSWYALVTNSNPIPVQYRITSTHQDISNKTCRSYWENLPNGLTNVYWTVCE